MSTSGASVRTVNAVNLALVFASGAAAWVAPWELFLLAYAVLGPLHYLTEISWLHDRGYFLPRRRDAAMLAGLGLVEFLHYLHLVPWNGWVLVAFGLATLAVASPALRAAVILAALAFGLASLRWSAPWLTLAVLLPTVIHVFAFTALFMLQGSVRHACPWGYASTAAFVGIGVALLVWHPPSAQYVVSTRTAALGEEFAPVIDQLLALPGAGAEWDRLAAVGRFLGFAYTYHYLNWFSKTGVIRWHEVGRAWMAGVGLVWALALALYAYDYRVGLTALGLLSLAHVFLEFPLDVRTATALLAAPFGGGTSPAARL